MYQLAQPQSAASDVALTRHVICVNSASPDARGRQEAAGVYIAKSTT